MSTSKAVMSRWSRPWRSAVARASWSWLTTPESASTCSGVEPVVRAASMAWSTRSLSQKPFSTRTSVRKRGGPPRRLGLLMPSQASGAASCASAPSVEGTGRRCGVSEVLLTGGVSHRLQRSRLPCPSGEAQRPLVDQDLQAVHRRASVPLGGLDELRWPGPVDEVHHAGVSSDGIGVYREVLELARPFVQPCCGAIDEKMGWGDGRRMDDLHLG